MATATFNPDASPETTSVDGSAGRDLRIPGPGSSWAAIHDGIGNTSLDNSSNLFVALQTSSTTDLWVFISRGFFLFDTSSLPDNAVISAADLRVRVGGTVTQTLTGQSIVVVSSSPASNTAIGIGDYDNLGTTAFCTPVALSDLTANVYNTFPLNASGIAAISLSGVTKLGVRLESDRANVEPTWASNVAAQLTLTCADNSGTASDPELVVTYTEASAPTIRKSFYLFD